MLLTYLVDVFVDRITDVNWNKKAFENLVIDTDTKHLVKALISNQIKSEKATDLISGKGNGLIILLHGWVSGLCACDRDVTDRGQRTWHRQDVYR